MKRLLPTQVQFAGSFSRVRAHPGNSPDPCSEWRTGELQEIDKEGLFIAANTIWPPRTKLALALTFPGERLPVRLSVEVAAARVSEPSGMLVKLVVEAPAEEQPARERLERALTRPASPSRRS